MLCRLSRCWYCVFWKAAATTCKPPSRAMSEVAAIFPKLLPHSPLCPPLPRALLRSLASPGQLLTVLGGSKPVSNPSVAGTTHTSPRPAAQLNTRPSPGVSLLRADPNHSTGYGLCTAHGGTSLSSTSVLRLLSIYIYPVPDPFYSASLTDYHLPSWKYHTLCS